MPAVTVQSNVDGSFTTYDTWRDFEYKEFGVTSHSDYAVSTIDTTSLAETAYEHMSSDSSDIAGYNSAQQYYMELEEPLGVQYDIDMPEGTTIYGVPEIHVQLATNTLDKDGLMVTAVLTDVADSGAKFKAFMTKESLKRTLPVKTMYSTENGGGLPDIDVKKFVQSNTYAKIVTYGWTDLCDPGKGIDSSEYTEIADLEEEEYYDYTFYMQPTVYTLAPGHHLVLTLTAWDPYCSFLDEDYMIDPEHYKDIGDHKYTFFIDNNTVTANIPVR